MKRGGGGGDYGFADEVASSRRIRRPWTGPMGDISATPDTGSRPPMAPLPGIVVCSSSSTPRPGRNGRGTIIADTTFRLQHPSTTNHANLDSFSLKVQTGNPVTQHSFLLKTHGYGTPLCDPPSSERSEGDRDPRAV
ncbi:uncharacterized protein CCOS01_00901 [Colletotrichum costaricense]|nr:uncharacterized protein CCOS01_00901 [Colletotrichum costaricense]KAK1539587.1 hypothetical protein CCOS01_00901 [Colletotrichum costaricense]